MKITIRQPDVKITADGKREYVLVEKSLDDIQVKTSSIISIDGSTTNTGLAILREDNGGLLYSCSFSRDGSSKEPESPVRYKVRLKQAVQKILERNQLIDKIYYEEPFIGYASAAPNLMMLRTFIEELIIENEPRFDYLKHVEINNKKWKKLFLAPDKMPTGTEAEKKAVRTKLEGFMPFLKDVTQDEIDAISMGFVATTHIRLHTDDELSSQKKPRPFQYNIKFIGANEDDDMLLEFSDVYSGPDYLLENGLAITTCKGTEDFNKHVYKHMGSEDKVLIIKYDSSKHGNLTLQYKIGHLAASYDYIYAIVWRKARKF